MVSVRKWRRSASNGQSPNHAEAGHIMDPSTVLLARPHPSIMESMSRFLSDAGYEPQPLASLEDMDGWNPARVAAVVVSTSVASAVQGSFEQVVRQALRSLPGVPLVFATAVEPNHARRVLSDTLDAHGMRVLIHTVEDGRALPAVSKSQTLALLINRHDLDDEAHCRRAATAFEALLDRRIAS